MAARTGGGVARRAEAIGARRRARAAGRAAGEPSARVAEIQRSRLLAAGVRSGR